jgi:hypothetical protein
MIPVAANPVPGQQNYGSTQPGPGDQAVQQRNQPRGQAYVNDQPGAGSNQDDANANARGWYSYNQQYPRRGQDADQPTYPYPDQARYQGRAPPSQSMDGQDSSDSQRYRADDRATRGNRPQRAYADQDDDPNAPARYRRYVPVAPPETPYRRSGSGPAFWGWGQDGNQ